MKKSILFLVAVLLAGLTAQAMLTEPVTFQGLKRTANNTSYFSWQIQSVWGEASLPNRQGSSYTFSNTNLNWNPVSVNVNGTLNFQEATAFTDVVTSGTFTVTFNCTTLWFDAAAVKTGSGGAVSGCSVTVSSDKHTVTVSIPSGKTFGQIVLDYVPNAPLSSSNTVIGGIASEYIYHGIAIEPVPTVTSGGRMLTAGTDYTVSYSGSNSVGTAILTVTGTGNYAGTVTKSYTIRNIALSDFRSLGSNTYEIATTTDLDNLALLVDVAENNCSGATFRQTADIAYSTTGLGDTGENFTTIGGYFNGSDKNFCGTYDGQGHTISGIRLYKNGTAAPSMNQGLFGRINTGATIKNVILADARITGYRYVGGIVGNKVDGTVQNCLVLSSTITCADKYVGALLGKNTGTLTANYYNNCTVNGTAGATGVGAGGNGGVSASSDLNGARSVHALTLPDGVTATGESVTIGSATYYAANTAVSLYYTDDVPDGYLLVFSLNGTPLEGYSFTMPAADATVTAAITAIDFNIELPTELEHGTVSSDKATAHVGETVTLNITPDEGYRVESVTVMGGDSYVDVYPVTDDTYSFVMPAADISVNAVIIAIDYNVELPEPEHCTIECDKPSAIIGTVVTLTITPDEGYRVMSVTVMNGNTPVEVTTVEDGTYTFVMPAADVTVTVEVLARYTYYSSTRELKLNWGEFNKDIKWGDEVVARNVKRVTATSEVSFTGDCSQLFYNFYLTETMDLSNVNTSQMTNAYRMFYNCLSLTSLNVSGWNTGKVTDMGSMFQKCSGLDSLDVSGWNTGNVTDMSGLFNDCFGLDSLDVSGFNTENVTKMNSMFSGCSALTSLDVSGFNTANVTDMSYMFRRCSGLDSLDISGWNTANVTNMGSMFSSCSGLDSLDVSGWNTGNVTDMSGLFYDCFGLTSLDVSGFNTANVTKMGWMFYDCSGMTTIYAGEEWSTEKVYNSDDMFLGCTSLVGGMGTTYEPSHTDAEYARIDGGLTNPGYFTAKSTALRGDVNGDNMVNIADVTALIDILLSGQTAPAAADCNGDGLVNIADVTSLIDYLLGGQWPSSRL